MSKQANIETKQHMVDAVHCDKFEPTNRNQTLDTQLRSPTGQMSVAVTKVPAKEAVKKREAKSSSTIKTALSGNVPREPFSAPPKSR